jgi:hypothetical protein
VRQLVAAAGGLTSEVAGGPKILREGTQGELTLDASVKTGDRIVLR